MCRPLREPTAMTPSTCVRETAGRSMFVPGAASGVPGKGSTSRPCAGAGRCPTLGWAPSATAVEVAAHVAARQPITTVGTPLVPPRDRASLSAALPLKPPRRLDNLHRCDRKSLRLRRRPAGFARTSPSPVDPASIRLSDRRPDGHRSSALRVWAAGGGCDRSRQRQRDPKPWWGSGGSGDDRPSSGGGDRA